MPHKRSSTAIRGRFRAQAKRVKANCHICGNEVDYGLPHTDPKSFVADHVVPLHRGGEDTLSNLAAAHRQQTVTATAPSGHAPTRRSSVAPGH